MEGLWGGLNVVALELCVRCTNNNKRWRVARNQPQEISCVRRSNDSSVDIPLIRRYAKLREIDGMLETGFKGTAEQAKQVGAGRHRAGPLVPTLLFVAEEEEKRTPEHKKIEEHDAKPGWFAEMRPTQEHKTLMHDMKLYLDLADAAYEPTESDMLRAANDGGGGGGGDDDGTEALWTIARSVTKPAPDRPAHVVFLDAARREIVIAVRVAAWWFMFAHEHVVDEHAG